ncbi:PREDICTED: defensin-like protein 242 [Camelina sativa]|uniref:Defensin-like protein 242 n=1 Tax=Camelina sativa TaxID=90675 RepID=A0ABM1QKX9_CAMSA|nr:PREDICTED: defensin-like protein 242 [Camelina sativa]
MKVTPIFLVSCVLFSLLPIHSSQDVSVFPPMKEPVYRRSKQVFNGSCTDRGSPPITCFLDFLGARSASEMPKNCTCTPLPKNKRLCECEVVQPW